ncbi:MAG: response regulator [Spirochaetes bacterium]|nr:response regulator [Spirochaetota bacterium]
MKTKSKVLIVDDEQINLDFFDVMLSKLGFQVEKAEDGEEALEKVRSFKPDVIILDNIMPKISGWEVTRILKHHEEFKEFRAIPIIMFSAMDDVKDKIEGFELGVEDYITKPFNFSEVLARIKAVLRHKDFTDQMLQRERRIALLESVNRLLGSVIEEIRPPIESLIRELETIDLEDREQMHTLLFRIKEKCLQFQSKFEEMDTRIHELQGHENDLRKQEVSLRELEERYQRQFDAFKGSGKG